MSIREAVTQSIEKIVKEVAIITPAHQSYAAIAEHLADLLDSPPEHRDVDIYSPETIARLDTMRLQMTPALAGRLMEAMARLEGKDVSTNSDVAKVTEALREGLEAR